MAIIYRTTDGTKWGAGKGSALTATEVDENFWGLDERVTDIEENPPAPIEIGGFQVVGTQMKVFMTDGTEYGPFTLPFASFNFREDWLPDVQYYELDLVTVAGRGLYMVRLDHISGDTFDPDATDGDGNALYQLVFGEDTYLYNFGFFYPGTPGNGMVSGDVLFAHLFNTPVYLPGDAADSYAVLRVPPAADMEFKLFKGGVEIGSLTFAMGSPNGVFTLTGGAPVQFSAGSVFYAQFPEDGLDVDARDLTVTLKGIRGDIPS